MQLLLNGVTLNLPYGVIVDVDYDDDGDLRAAVFDTTDCADEAVSTGASVAQYAAMFMQPNPIFDDLTYQKNDLCGCDLCNPQPPATAHPDDVKAADVDLILGAARLTLMRATPDGLRELADVLRAGETLELDIEMEL